MAGQRSKTDSTFLMIVLIAFCLWFSIYPASVIIANPDMGFGAITYGLWLFLSPLTFIIAVWVFSTLPTHLYDNEVTRVSIYLIILLGTLLPLGYIFFRGVV